MEESVVEGSGKRVGGRGMINWRAGATAPPAVYPRAVGNRRELND
jgi:hypothetical protein